MIRKGIKNWCLSWFTFFYRIKVFYSWNISVDWIIVSNRFVSVCSLIWLWFIWLTWILSNVFWSHNHRLVWGLVALRYNWLCPAPSPSPPPPPPPAGALGHTETPPANHSYFLVPVTNGKPREIKINRTDHWEATRRQAESHWPTGSLETSR